jgi:hypothetical protein
MTKRYLALTGEDLKREHKAASPSNMLTQKRVRKGILTKINFFPYGDFFKGGVGKEELTSKDMNSFL